ncbi:hypothetical protein P3L44_10165 [Providencia sp. PROV175]|uniref:hypothetical protein n=1 Tax=Providencia sp. PROV175 TaxID=2949878 RepID=UPI0029352E6F|nr:hypothetical protein [Providencia sp. PROV175]WOB89103.1 hypothetical protein P3L44_10165 [Providencia sp. PROV175]
MSKRATYNVTESRKIKLERLAINASVKLERTVTWTELLTYKLIIIQKNYQKISLKMKLRKKEIDKLKVVVEIKITLSKT